MSKEVSIDHALWRYYLSRKGVKACDVCIAAQVAECRLYSAFRGRKPLPIAEVRRLAKALGVSVQDLTGEAQHLRQGHGAVGEDDGNA